MLACTNLRQTDLGISLRTEDGKKPYWQEQIDKGNRHNDKVETGTGNCFILIIDIMQWPSSLDGVAHIHLRGTSAQNFTIAHMVLKDHW